MRNIVRCSTLLRNRFQKSTAMRRIIPTLACLMLTTSPFGQEKVGAKSTSSLFNKWVFVCFENVSTGGRDFPIDRKIQVNIEFKSPDKMKGKGPCNYYEGNFKKDNKGALTITSLKTTQMACLNGMEWESEYFNALEKADHYEIKRNELRIYFNDKTEAIIYKTKDR